jgi:hypothetical protein
LPITNLLNNLYCKRILFSNKMQMFKPRKWKNCIKLRRPWNMLRAIFSKNKMKLLL